MKRITQKLVASGLILLTAMGVGALLTEAYSVDSQVAIIGAWLVTILFAGWSALLLYETINIEEIDTSDDEND